MTDRIKFLRIVLLLIFLAVLTGCQPKEITTAKIYIQKNEWREAVEPLEIAVQNNPKNAEARCLLGQAYGNTGRFKEMNYEFQRSLELSEKFSQFISDERERHWVDNYNAGIVMFDQQEYEKSETHFKMAVTIDPTKHEAHRKLALCYLKMNKLANALFVYNQLLEKYPNDLDLLVSVANLYSRQNKYQETVAVWNKVLLIEPNHADALVNLALTYDRFKNPDEAERAFEIAVKAHAQDENLLFLYGVFHFKRQNYQKSIALFKRVLELHPNEFKATSNIGNAYLSLAEELREKLKEAGKNGRPPEVIQKLRNQVVLNYKFAIPHLEKALDMQPGHVNLWRNLGVAYFNTGQQDKGEEAFLRSEELQLKSTQ
ncbi:MAG: tetratricopeptide repeat protein [bacterium]